MLKYLLSPISSFMKMVNGTEASRILKRIGTHSGVFHCDEALACYMLKLLPEFEDAEIVRTRDQKVIVYIY